MTPKYRPDIDGLRALAVLSVVLFHSGFSDFSGGYVGVDVFFVISGYLITTIIVREIENNNFSISRFYERRFRRILPALVVVVVATLAAGLLLLTPQGLVELGQSAIATSLFYSNMFFYFQSGYFGGAAEMKPLLHTWSLAVEEQYYIFFPLLLVLIAKVDSKHYLTLLAVLGSLSLGASVVLTASNASGAFYWIPARAWELFIGSILALNVIPRPNGRLLRELLSMLGMAMIVYSIFQYTPQTPFPGVAAAVPTIGTAFVILAGAGGYSLISGALSWRPVVFVGLISYSLYLWHWPVIVYSKIYFIKEPTGSAMVAILALIFVLSIVSWRYVETPFRKKRFLREKRSVLGASAMVSSVIVLGGFMLIGGDGLPGRINDVAVVSSVNKDKWRHWGECEDYAARLRDGQRLCDIGAVSGRASFIVWGDSHARALASGIDLSAKKFGVSGKIATQSACPPLLSIDRPGGTSCYEFNKEVLEYISDSPGVDTVILASRWALSTKGVRYKQESGDPVRLRDVESQDSSGLSNVDLFQIGLTRTIDKLHELGKTIVLVKSVPEIGYDVPSAYLVANMTGREVNNIIAPSVKEYMERTEEVYSIFSSLEGRASITLVAPDSLLCNDSYCSVTVDGAPLYRDDDHLSTFGSEYISKAFDRIFSLPEESG